MANPVYVNEGHNSGNTGSATTLAITLPATPAEGDVMVAGLYTDSGRTVNTLSGWTALTTESNNNKVLQTFVREAGPAEGTVKTWTFSSNYANPYGGIIPWFSGADDPVTNPPDIVDGNGTATGTVTIPALTVSENESVAISFASPSDNQTITGYPSGETTIYNLTGTGTSALAAGYRNANAGSAGAIDYTDSGFSRWTAARIALAPTAGASPKLHMPFVNRKVFQPIKRASVR
jgi:hypothetical protein